MATDIRGRGRAKDRGSILLLALFFLLVLLTLSIAFFRIIPAEFHSADQARKEIQATYAADSGARHAVAWLRDKTASSFASIIPDADVATYNSNHFGSHATSFGNDWDLGGSDGASSTVLNSADHRVDDNWGYLSRIVIDDSDFFRRIYAIETCAYLRDRPMHVTKVFVQNESFAEYALFISDWKNDFVYTMTPNGIQGPLHTNGYPRVAAPDAAFFTAEQDLGGGVFVPEDPWVSGPLARITHAESFRGDSTSPDNILDLDGDGVLYANGNAYANDGLVPYDPSNGAPDDDKYARIIENGRDNIRVIPNIPIPEENSYLSQDAWGKDSGGNYLPLPSNNSEWNTASNGDKVLVSTTTGIANDPNGEVAGGIYIRDRNADHVLLDITPDGHQKIRVKQGNVTVPNPDNSTYYTNEPTYYRTVDHPEETVPGPPVCDGWHEVTEDVIEYQDLTHTHAHAGICPEHVEFIPGEGGISIPITVVDDCEHTHPNQNPVVVGTTTSTECNSWTPGPPVTNPPWTQWIWLGTDDSHPDAQPTGNTTQVPANAGDPGAIEVPGTSNINRWTSVVEVNESNGYQIPYYDGVEVNGVVASDASDPILTIADGNTVVINNDTYADGRDWAEYTVIPGRTNGVVYSDVHLHNVRGTNKGAKYADPNGDVRYQGRIIATDIGSNRRLNIRDGILQFYDGSDTYTDDDGNTQNMNDGRDRLAPGAETPGPEHVLGIVAADVNIRPSSSSRHRDNNDNMGNNQEREKTYGGRDFLGGFFRGGINVYAVIMAGRTLSNGNEDGGFGADNSAMQNWDGLGDFNLYGGIISAESRKTQNNDGSDNNGFRLGLNYDPVAAASIPYFPQTPEFKPLRYVTYNPD